MYQLLVVISLISKVCKASLIFTFISIINNLFVLVVVVGGVMGGVEVHLKSYSNSLTLVKWYCFPFILSFWLISLIFEPIHVVS